MDTLSAEDRSHRMALIHGKDTKPEMIVRRLAHRLGYRFRLHHKRLPGHPDLAFPGRKAVVLTHGCFWHRHADPDCSLARLPKSRLDFWLPKLESNRRRDDENRSRLEAMGWRVLAIWECELRELDAVTKRLVEFLGPRGDARNGKGHQRAD
jgi:DNA mismatch endonuclease (patch repair protein)